MSEKPDLYYIELVLDGDNEAFSTLLSRYRNLVFTLCVKMVGDTASAEDVAQEAFVKAYQSLHKFKKQSKFSSWLYRIAYNASIDYLNQQKKKVKKEQDATYFDEKNEKSIDEDLVLNEKATYIKTCLSNLPETERSILTLFYYQDESVADIAKTLKISESNVKVKLFRARKELKAIFEKKKEFLDI